MNATIRTCAYNHQYGKTPALPRCVLQHLENSSPIHRLESDVPYIVPVEAHPSIFPEALHEAPFEASTVAPSEAPSLVPTVAPISVPSEMPSKALTEAPTAVPSEVPSEGPVATPSEVPTATPPEVRFEAPPEVSTATPPKGGRTNVLSPSEQAARQAPQGLIDQAALAYQTSAN
jgi:hypothetical protein